jgi:short-subunit dehydrogenase
VIKKHTSTRDVALITGASSGIGLEFARLFARDGYDLVLVARNRSNLEHLSSELTATYQVQATVMVQDLAYPAAAQAIIDELARQGLAVHVLINNAGTQVFGEYAKSSLPQLLDMVQVNATGLMQLTHLLLPGMIRAGRGRILNVGSTGSFAPGPLNAVYCATKAFVLSFSAAIGAELAGTGVTVTALCPGATDTPFITRHGMQGVRIFHNAMSPGRVAEIGYRALRRGRPLIVPGLINQMQVLGFQFMTPFLGWTPPGWLLAVGKIFMGRSHPASHPIRQA